MEALPSRLIVNMTECNFDMLYNLVNGSYRKLSHGPKHQLTRYMYSAFLWYMQEPNVPEGPEHEQTNIIHLFPKDQGPISSTSLRRVFVLKTSYEVRTLKIGFHQTIELCELLTFCRIFKTNI